MKACVQSKLACRLATPLMCCQSGECRSGLSLIFLQLTVLTLRLATLQLALTVPPARLITNMTTTYHFLQLMAMHGNGYKNSSRCYAEASFTLHGLHTTPMTPLHICIRNPTRFSRYAA